MPVLSGAAARDRVGPGEATVDQAATATEVSVLLAEGRYEQADAGARELLQSHVGVCRASGYQLLAAAAVAAGEAGELPPQEVRHRVALALIGLHGDGSDPAPGVMHKVAQTAAYAELLDGRPELAARLARARRLEALPTAERGAAGHGVYSLSWSRIVDMVQVGVQRGGRPHRHPRGLLPFRQRQFLGVDEGPQAFA